tara:strand:+ start:303 stop:482 length:180 start_codon:yes stop_codon:yes gene_type:complete
MKIEDLRDWLDVEIAEAIEIAAKLEATAEAVDYGDWDGEMARLNQEGFVMALEFVRRQL